MKLRLKYQLCIPSTRVCCSSVKGYTGLSLLFFFNHWWPNSVRVLNRLKLDILGPPQGFFQKKTCCKLGHLLQEQIPVLELLLQTLAGAQHCLGLCWATHGHEEMSPVPSSSVTPVVTSCPCQSARGCRKGPLFVCERWWCWFLAFTWGGGDRQWEGIGLAASRAFQDIKLQYKLVKLVKGSLSFGF